MSSPRILLVSKTMVYHLIVVMYCRSHIACMFRWVVTIADIYKVSFPTSLFLSEDTHCGDISKNVQKCSKGSVEYWSICTFFLAKNDWKLYFFSWGILLGLLLFCFLLMKCFCYLSICKRICGESSRQCESRPVFLAVAQHWQMANGIDRPFVMFRCYWMLLTICLLLHIRKYKQPGIR